MRYPQVVLVCAFLAGNAEALDDSHWEAARALIEASQAEKMLDSMYAQFDPIFEKMKVQLHITEEQEPIFDRYLAEMTRIMKEEMSWENMEPMILEIYVDVYTEDELVAITEFYTSPTGKTLLAKMPEVMEASSQISIELMQGYLIKVQQMQADLREELARSEEAKQNVP